MSNRKSELVEKGEEGEAVVTSRDDYKYNIPKIKVEFKPELDKQYFQYTVGECQAIDMNQRRLMELAVNTVK